MEHEHQYSQDVHYSHHPPQWPEGNPYYQQHASPQTEYNGFANYGSMPLAASQYGGPTPAYQQHRASHSQLQPLVMPQWPSSMLGNQGIPPQQIYSAPAQLQPSGPSSGPQLASSHNSTPSQPAPRRTLTDADRRRMCLYHDEHPTKKQTEIGEIFGVERSTVSKVLRQKEKYLAQEDGSRSPIKRPSKSKNPDIERTLAIWIKNKQSKGVPLTDEAIKNQARTFKAAAGANTETTMQIENASWLEKFKLKNNIGGTSSKTKRSPSLQHDSSNALGILTGQLDSKPSPSAYNCNLSPHSADMSQDQSQDSNGFGHVYTTSARAPHQSQSNTSLSSAFAEHGHAGFSSGNTSANSPLFSPDIGAGHASSYFPAPSLPTAPRNHSMASVTSDQASRRRSQTFPSHGLASGPQSDSSYISPPPTTVDGMTPKYQSSHTLESPMSSDMQPPPLSHYPSNSSIGGQQQSGGLSLHHTIDSKTHSQSPNGSENPYSLVTPSTSPTLADARKGLETALTFLERSPEQLAESADFMTMARVIEKLRLRQQVEAGGSNLGGLPGGLHRIPECEFGVET